MTTRIVIETLIDMKFILQDETGVLAERFYHHSLYNFLNLATGDLDGNRQDMEDALAAAEQRLGDLKMWASAGGRQYNLRERADAVGLSEVYEVWYRHLSSTVHSSLMGMRAFEPEGHYIVGFSATSMHRPMLLIPIYLVQAFDEYRHGNKITASTSSIAHERISRQASNLPVPPDPVSSGGGTYLPGISPAAPPLGTSQKLSRSFRTDMCLSMN